MKCYKRYLLLLVCLVLCLTSFSVVANAEEVTKPYSVSTQSWYVTSGDWFRFFPNFTFVPGDGVETTRSQELFFDDIYYVENDRLQLVYSFQNSDNSLLAYKDISTKVTIENLYYSYLYTYTDLSTNEQTHIYNDTPDSYYARIHYEDGSYDDYISFTLSKAKTAHCYNIELEFTPSKDVYAIEFRFTQNYKAEDVIITSYAGEFGGDNQFILSVKQPSEEATLLGGIWESLKGGFSDLGEKLSGGFSNVVNTLTSGFKTLTDGISNVVNSITELPSKIWAFIEDGLKKLFIPDEDYIADYKDRWEELLADRLGAVYQVVQITFESWDRINNSDITNTIEMPEVEIPLPDNEKFSFGGYDVKIVPDGFDILATAVKTISGIVCSIAFINGLRKRYDEIMGVEQ